MSFLREKSIRTTLPIGEGGFCTAEVDIADGQTVIKEINALLIGGKYIRDYTKEQFTSEVIDPAVELLDSKYGLAQFIPQFHFEWGLNNKGLWHGFFVMEKVSGTDIEKVYPLSIEQATQLDELIANSLIAAKTSRHNGSYLRPDIFHSDHDAEWSLTNIVLGRTSPNQPVRPYIVDLYPARWSILPEFRGLKDPLKGLINNLPKQAHGYQYPKSQNALLQR